ncbi:hypothetical protein A5736_13355 [Mycobacterium sp. SP-6446]|nr:hypothetical protein A5736_13355 [Mycobacterium sp. SP-6446]
MGTLRDKTAVITGAGGCIGRVIAFALTERRPGNLHAAHKHWRHDSQIACEPERRAPMTDDGGITC